jgi:hypothetical protein
MASVPALKSGLPFNRMPDLLSTKIMKNTKQQIIKLANCLALLTLIVLSACQPITEQSSEPPTEEIIQPASEQPPTEIHLGYCPTMAPHVQAFIADHPSLVPQRFDNSALAMRALLAGQVQAILIGRSAWENERTDQLRLVLLSDGLTLIVQQPGAIRYEDLSRVRILTHESKAAIQDLLPPRTNIIHYDDYDQMRSALDGTVALLVRWSQVTPMDNLLVPVDQAGLKIPAFRSPHFYYLASMEEKVAPLLAAFSSE